MPLEDLTPQTRIKLKQASCWKSPGHLTLVPQWVPLPTASKSAPAFTGLYALGLQRGLKYDKGQTRIVYIGSAKDLGNRLGTHARTPHNDTIRQLQDALPDEPLAAWWAIPGLSKKWLLGLEGEALWTFERTFGTVPIGNLDIPESSVSERCEGLVAFTPGMSLDEALSLEDYARLIGCALVREEKTPIGNPSEVSISMRMSDKGELIIGSRKYNAASFYTQEEPTQEQNGQCDVSTKDEDPFLDTNFVIHETNVAVWPVLKMKELIDTCSRLSPEKSRGPSSVKRFQAPTREVPMPHTWGEVAVVQGRLVAGTWYPSSRTWVKILSGKELLGQAFLSAKSDHGESRFRGEDISDLPQRTDRRPGMWGDDAGEASQSPLMQNLIANMDAIRAATDAAISNLEDRVYEGTLDETELDLLLKKQNAEEKKLLERQDRLWRAETRRRLVATAKQIESLFQKASDELGRT